MQLHPAQSLQTLPQSSTRLTHRRLRSPTRLPSMTQRGAVARYLDRLSWLFGAG